MGIAKSSLQITMSMSIPTLRRMNSVCPLSRRYCWMERETSCIIQWKITSASGDPGRVPLWVLIRECDPIVIQVESWTLRSNRIRWGGAPSSCRILGTVCPRRRRSAGVCAASKASKTCWNLAGSWIPMTNSRIRQWKAVLKSTNRTPMFRWSFWAVRPRTRSAWEPNRTSCCWKPPSCPGRRWWWSSLMTSLRNKACKPLASVGSNKIPRKCCASVGWGRLGMRAIGPPLYWSGSMPRSHTFRSKGYACSASSAACQW